MNENDRNRITLWRKFDRAETQPVARGDGLIGENDFKITGSMWPSRKGAEKDGTPWQMWSVSLKPAQGETRRLVAVPPELVEKVFDLIAATSEAGYSATPDVPQPPDSVEPTQDDLPF